jgi:molybdopterin-guanine dinucleotide biosynthesis protein A
MGTDKLFLEWEGQTLFEKTVAKARRIADEVIVSVHRPLPIASPTVRQVVDLVPDQGPLMGLFTALSACRSPRALLLSPDVPFLPDELLLSIKDACPSVDMVVPRWRGRTEPLCGVYSKTVLPAIKACLKRGERSLKALVQTGGISIAYLSEGVLRSWGDPALMFLNVNTPEDYRKALKLLRARLSTANPPRYRADRVSLETASPPEFGKEKLNAGRLVRTGD